MGKATRTCRLCPQRHSQHGMADYQCDSCQDWLCHYHVEQEGAVWVCRRCIRKAARKAQPAKSNAAATASDGPRQFEAYWEGQASNPLFRAEYESRAAELRQQYSKE